MRKTFLVFAFFLFSVQVFAVNPEKCLFFRVFWEKGDYQIDSLRIVMDFPLEVDPEGDYLVKLLDSKGTALYQHKTKKASTVLEQSIEPLNGETTDQNIVIDFDTIAGTQRGQMFFLLPYTENAKKISFEHGTAVLAEADLSVLCQANGKCESQENFLSCPQDCPLSEKDNYCYAFTDGTCDPDCIEGFDSDCTKSNGVKKEQFSLEQVYFIGVVVLAFALMVSYNVLRKRTGKK
ncbi:MAG: hypothetical protein QXK06_02065 [Candidatus Diapherotrites archaeon]